MGMLQARASETFLCPAYSGMLPVRVLGARPRKAPIYRKMEEDSERVFQLITKAVD